MKARSILSADEADYEVNTEMTEPNRPTIARPDENGTAQAAVEAFVADLQVGWDTNDAAIADRRLSADVAWGSPYGATINDFQTLTDIHHRLKAVKTGGSSSRFQIERVLPISADVVVAHVRRLALDTDGNPFAARTDTDGAFSETAMYVLVRRDNTWWLAAGQNTSIRPGGEA